MKNFTEQNAVNKRFKEMKMTYIYPQNMRAAAKIWLWTMKDFAIIFIAALLSAVFITQAGFFIPAAITLCYAFMSIRLDDTSVMDYIKCAVSFFLTSQQEYRWG